jgi:transcriptional regulator with XRE-family HTH domain
VWASDGLLDASFSGSIRLAKGFTQESLADTVGLHRTYIGNIERDEESVSVVNAAKIAKALKVSLSELFKGL